MIGIRLAALRRACNMSQLDLANELGISCSTVGMYEQGRREPSLEILEGLSDVFGVSIDFLVTGRPATNDERAAMEALVLNKVAATESRLVVHRPRHFTRQELAVLFATMLLES